MHNHVRNRRFSAHELTIFMSEAIKVAEASRKHKGVAIGAVLVNNHTGVIAARGGSMVHKHHDPSAHAEINAIRTLTKKLQSDDLYDYTLFSTLEPCLMCLSAATWARIHRVYFGAYRRDVDPTLFDVRGNLHDERQAKRMNLRERLRMRVKGGILEQQCGDLLDGYHDSARHSGR